jgi:AraC-like DNA-binding protein
MSTPSHPDDAPPASIRVAERSYMAEPGFHRHRYYQLIFPHQGALLMRVEGRRVAVSPAEWTLIPPGAEHTYWAEGPNRVLVADLAAHVIAGQPEAGEEARAPQHPLDGRLAALAGLLQSELRAGALGEPLVAEALAGYVGAAVRLALRPGSTPAERPAAHLAGRARDILEAGALGPLSLEQVAATVGVSLAHLQRSFRAAYGLSMLAYVQGLRLRRAQALLLEGELPVEAVAAAVGLASPSYFTRLFTRELGVSPAAFRRRGRTAE